MIGVVGLIFVGMLNCEERGELVTWAHAEWEFHYQEGEFIQGQLETVGGNIGILVREHFDLIMIHMFESDRDPRLFKRFELIIDNLFLI